MKTTTVPENRQRGKYSTVKLCMYVLEPGTSSTCSASSTMTACFPPPSSCSSYPQLFSLTDCCFPTCAFQQALSLLYSLYSHLNCDLTDAGFLAPGSNRPICALDEAMSGWLCAKATKVAKWRLPPQRCWMEIQTRSEAD